MKKFTECFLFGISHFLIGLLSILIIPFEFAILFGLFLGLMFAFIPYLAEDGEVGLF